MLFGKLQADCHMTFNEVWWEIIFLFPLWVNIGQCYMPDLFLSVTSTSPRCQIPSLIVPTSPYLTTDHSAPIPWANQLPDPVLLISQQICPSVFETHLLCNPPKSPPYPPWCLETPRQRFLPTTHQLYSTTTSVFTPGILSYVLSSYKDASYWWRLSVAYLILLFNFIWSLLIELKVASV